MANETVSAPTESRRTPIWASLLDELPYVAIIVLALVGISWTSISGASTTSYWVILTPVFALICIVTGWRHTLSGERASMVVTQILQWAAVLVAMYLIAVSGGRAVLNTNATGLMLLTLLALGLFVSGLNLRAWKLCLTGAFLAIAVPAIAWVEQAALLLLLIGLALIGVLLLYWWLRRGKWGA
jgi:hypothetical protein